MYIYISAIKYEINIAVYTIYISFSRDRYNRNSNNLIGKDLG